ncbi:ribokinase [Mycolicibacter terrae]|uniref:Ribokinase n=2 Tax=Mycolicibacter TaxID=1073531 RepID=A0A1A2NM72_MYCSD|nr:MULTISPECIES: PfkB family carbohydrate kinase [Mycolicibacter]OBH16175.1 ribokinase [Mycolicibacter sinensis]OBI34121.1 ribokinase [Mycolicibacter sinensis]RRR48528.1 ribokinase [Mycolicibacter terrae]
MTVTVVGQIGRDLVLRSAGLPPAGGSARVLRRRELLGGKGANQAVGLAQLGVPAALIGVVGDDDAGAAVCEQAVGDGVDISGVTRRGETALLVDLVDEPASRRLFEHIPESSLLTAADVQQCDTLIARSAIVSLQLQQPAEATLAAARLARRHGAQVVADGNPPAEVRDEMLCCVDVLRADAEEAALLAGEPVTCQAAARALADRLLVAGVRLVALAVPGVGDLLVWSGGQELLGLSKAPVVDPTGAGDAFVAGLIAGLRRGPDPRRAGRLAAAAAAACVPQLGGRPHLADLALPGVSGSRPPGTAHRWDSL